MRQRSKVVSQRVVEAIRARELLQSQIPSCQLPQYREIVSNLVRPADEQIEDYVRFVSEAHSWYKHLPLLPPGVPFRFFLDPLSGVDRVLRVDGSVSNEDRTENSPRFHYTWMTTKEYRTRFGHLAYESRSGRSFFLQTAGQLREYAERPIVSTQDAAFRVPAEIAEAGEVEVTAIIHPLTARACVWEKFLPMQASRSLGWPRETGGDRTMHEILSLCERRKQQTGRVPDETDQELATLFLPERRRLYQTMNEAIHRMLRVAYE